MKYYLAPMMGYTDCYFRNLAENIYGNSIQTFSEMIVDKAIIYNETKTICRHFLDNNKSAIQSILNAENYMKNSGYSVVILPEGTRTLDGELQKFKKGGFHMAKNTNMSIVPIVSYGAYNYKPKNRFILKPGVIKVSVGKPIITNDLSVEELRDQTYSQMKKLIEELKC